MAAIPFLKQNSVCDSDGLRGKTPVSVLFQAFCAQLDMFSLICLQTSGTRGHVQNEMSSHLFKNVLFVFFFLLHQNQKLQNMSPSFLPSSSSSS